MSRGMKRAREYSQQVQTPDRQKLVGLQALVVRDDFLCILTHAHLSVNNPAVKNMWVETMDQEMGEAESDSDSEEVPDSQ